MALITPKPATLKKYGLSVEEWQAMADDQQGVCYVCHQLPKGQRLHIDHDHVKRWKHLPPQERKKAVRGLLCFRCNTSFVGRGITPERAHRVYLYLAAYESRRAANDNAITPTAISST